MARVFSSEDDAANNLVTLRAAEDFVAYHALWKHLSIYSGIHSINNHCHTSSFFLLFYVILCSSNKN